MSYINQNEIIYELVFAIRNSDVFSTSERGVTRTTETFSGDNSTLTFTLSNLLLKNIKSVTVDGQTLKYGYDYFYNIQEFTPSNSPTITFNTAPALGTDNISITYDHGNSDKVFADSSMEVLKSAKNYPRIVISITDFPSEAGGFGNVNRSDIVFSVTEYGKNKFNLREDMHSVREYILDNKNNFFYLKCAIYPQLQSPVIPEPTISPKMFQITQDFKSWFNYEINN